MRLSGTVVLVIFANAVELFRPNLLTPQKLEEELRKTL
jgi:hypothetical protein